MFKKWFILTLALLYTQTAFASLSDADTKKAYSFVERIYTDINAQILKQNTSRDDKYTKVKKILIGNMDLKKISSFVLGPHWKSADAHQKESFMVLFNEFQTQHFTNVLNGYSGQTISLIGTEKSNGNQVFVNMKVTDETAKKAEPIELKWRVNKSGSSFKVVDVVIGGISMALTLKGDYESHIKKATENGYNGFNSLIEELDKKIELEKNGGSKK